MPRNRKSEDKPRRRSRGEGGLFRVANSPFWRAQYVDATTGKQVRVSTGKIIKQEAIGVLQKLMVDTQRGLAPPPTKLYYGDLRQALLDNYMEKGNRSLLTDGDGEETVPGLQALDEFFGFGTEKLGPKVAHITTDTAREFVRTRKDQGVGNAWINRSLACLRRMLTIAQQDRKIQVAPKIHFMNEPDARQGFLELQKFEELLALLPTHLRPLVSLLYYCGVRVGEAQQIQWDQVDLDTRLIRLQSDQTKNKEARLIPLPSPLIAILREMKPKKGFVFDATNLRNEWQIACAACGLGKRDLITPDEGYPWYKYEGLLIHDLRRSAVRNLVRAGVQENVAMKITGHKTRAVFDRYNITSTADITDAMRRVEVSGLSDTSVTLRPGKRVRRKLSLTK
jgi:integrase